MRVLRGTLATMLLAVSGLIVSSGPAAAHSPDFCGHYDYTNGGWRVDYVGYLNDYPNHYHFYDHYLYGSYQHTAVWHCGYL